MAFEDKRVQEIKNELGKMHECAEALAMLKHILEKLENTVEKTAQRASQLIDDQDVTIKALMGEYGDACDTKGECKRN